MTIHRNTNYIKFIAARNTNACNAGQVLEAWKDECGNWHLYNPFDGIRYQATPGIIRAIAGEELEQGKRELSLGWRLAH